MADILKNIEEHIGKDDKLIDIWGRRDAYFERKYEQSVLRVLTDYGIGASENTNAKGKILGAGYEAYIIAFFIGLYANKKLPLSDDIKKLGQPIDKWGNLDSKKFRHAYPALRSYIFIALIAKTDIDWIALDKGDIKVNSVAAKLVETMQEYANYGFSVMEEKLKEDPAYFFSHRSFLDMFLQLTTKGTEKMIQDETPEEL